ncbi:double-strand break repair protein AddB [Rhabdaerophilum calidifontis]|uniref:double-strand break repair protein AddB n=1 Tax=Rhabdaerophilum calidifontis TaxID=2604328 RepID=UPI00123B5FEF|nr:double-strand break repair protein AddB [Rhabdaerophilum calidifontis]
MARARPAVFTIAPGADFARETVAALLAGRLIALPFATEPARLADLVIHVPTRRVRPLLEAAFAAALAPRAAILPVIRPLAEPADPFEAGFDIEAGFAAGASLDPRPVGVAERRFRLLPLVEAWRRGLSGAGKPDLRGSLALADQLGRLIDEMRIAGIPLAALESAPPPGYDPARFDLYWTQSREFLRIAARYWPQVLEEIGGRDAMDLRLAAIEAETARLVATDPKTPVLVIGSTGSVPATARLMRAVARLDYGAVVLPGLDRDRLDPAAWALIGAPDSSLATRVGHPQASLKRTLAEIGIDRADVVPLGPDHPRNSLIVEALRPAESVDRWRETRAGIDLDAALAGLCVIDAPDEREEALAIAILMRETLEDPVRRVAFVTADRGLAERVGAELRRFGINATDSAGVPLGARPAGRLARLFLKAAREMDGAALLALLRDPLTRLDRDAATIARLADALEILVLRGRHFSPASSLAERIRAALAAPPRARGPAARIEADRRAELPALGAALDALLAPFATRLPETALGPLVATLAEALRMLTRDEDGTVLLEQDPDGADLLDLLAETGAHGAAAPVRPADLGPALDLLLEGMRVARGTPEARAVILGPLEARLVAADRVILGGLREGAMPPVPPEDPFLNRAMRLDLGLQPPEWRIGQSAHDFQMLAGHADLVLSHARRAGDQPSLPSRFLRRLEAILGAERWKTLTERGEAILALGRALDAAGPEHPAPRPTPIPVAPRLPERLAITEIETLRRDPYAIYARHLLALEPLEQIDPEPDAREKGTFLHRALELYCAAEPPADPDLAAQRLREIGAECFAPLRHEPELFEFWWRQFEAIIPGFVRFDRARRMAGNRVLVERGGHFALSLPSGPLVTIHGKADRLEMDGEGRLTVLDYKSGTLPGAGEIAAGLAAQLPITAALACRGAFADIDPSGGIAALAHVPIGDRNSVEAKWIKTDPETADAFVARQFAALVADLDALARGAMPYLSRARMKADRDGAYDHLARFGEWSPAEAEPDAEEDEA